MYAIERNQHLMVEYLIAKGADPNAMDDFGRTPLVWLFFFFLN